MSEPVTLVTLNCEVESERTAFEAIRAAVPAFRELFPRQGHIVLAAFPTPGPIGEMKAAPRAASKATRGRKR